MPHIERIESPAHLPARIVPPKENYSCFRGMLIKLQKFGKTVDSFLVGADTTSKGAARFIAQWEQDRAHGARPPRQSPPMSWSMHAAKRRNARERLLSKIPAAVNRIFRSRGRVKLTEHGCAIRDAFQAIALECLGAEKSWLNASQSSEPLTADDVSTLIAKCDAYYARDFTAMVDSMLRKSVRGKNWSMSSILQDVHRQIFGKAVTAMEEEMTRAKRDQTGCNKKMWSLFDSANTAACARLKNLGPSFRGPKQWHPAMEAASIAPAMPASGLPSSSVDETAAEKAAPVMKKMTQQANDNGQELSNIVATREMSTQTSSTEEVAPTQEIVRHEAFRVKHLREMGTQTPRAPNDGYGPEDHAASNEEIGALISQAIARNAKSQRPDCKIFDHSREYVKKCNTFLETRSTVCNKVVTRHQKILVEMTVGNLDPKLTIAKFKSVYADTFRYHMATFPAEGRLPLNALLAAHDTATKVAVSLAFQTGKFGGEISMNKLEAFKAQLVRISRDIDREIRMLSVLNGQPITTLANSRIQMR